MAKKKHVKKGRNFIYMTEEDSIKLKRMFKDFGGYEAFLELYINTHGNAENLPSYQVVNSILNGRQKRVQVLEVLNIIAQRVNETEKALKETLGGNEEL
jgi:uncharacterized membrane protein